MVNDLYEKRKEAFADAKAKVFENTYEKKTRYV